MSIFELFIVAVGLSMDAFAVSVCKGLSVSRVNGGHYIAVGAYFGVFQAVMPLIGYLLGTTFQAMIAEVDHWVAFILLGLIGANMVRESFSGDERIDPDFSPRAMLPLAVATSIDALAVGVTLAFLRVSIVPAVVFIGTVTFLLSMAGLRIGSSFGSKYRSKAELAGGVVLILMGLKILLEHLNIL